MIGRLSGQLLEKSPPRVLVDVGGVGYEVDVPMSTMYARTSFTGNTGQTVTVEAFGHILTGI